MCVDDKIDLLTCVVPFVKSSDPALIRYIWVYQRSRSLQSSTSEEIDLFIVANEWNLEDNAAVSAKPRCIQIDIHRSVIQLSHVPVDAVLVTRYVGQTPG